MIVVAFAIIYPVLMAARHSPAHTQALSKVKQADLGCEMYSSDHDDHLPIAGNWMDGIEPYLDGHPELLHSPNTVQLTDYEVDQIRRFWPE